MRHKLIISIAAMVFSSNALPANNLSEIPLFIQQGVEPNIILTIDDSNSMRRGYDEFVLSSSNYRKRIYLASDQNPLYFNPSVGYSAPIQANGQPYVTSFSSAFFNGFRTDKGTTNLGSDYLPTTRYDSTGNQHQKVRHMGQDGPFEAGRAFFYTWTPTLPACTGDLLDDGCYVKQEVSAAQEQNFASWFSFYRTRLLTAQTAANRAFHALPESVRVAFQSYNCGGFAFGDCRDSQEYELVENRLRNFSGEHRAELFNWLGNLTSSYDGTPLRSATARVGEYLKIQSGVNSPYAFSPSETEQPIYSCRRNYHVALTDGLWTGSRNSIQNLDSRSATLPDGRSYVPRAPYQDQQVQFPSNGGGQDGDDTLADIAFQYWSSDLAAAIANDVVPSINQSVSDSSAEYWLPQNDPATWQHMVNYFVGFGLQNFLVNPPYIGSTFSGGFSQLLSGAAQWPFSNEINGEGWNEVRAYDLWHAAINSRGEFFSTSNSTDLEIAFRNIVERITRKNYSSSAANFDSAISSGLTRSYITSFDSEDWSGDVRAFRTSNNQLLWSAKAQLAAANVSERKIQFSRAESLVDFKWGSLNSTERALFNTNAFSLTDVLGQQRLNWVRGDQSGEGSGGGFRTRSSLLGDIVESSAVFVGKPDLVGLGDSYAAFASQQALREERVYVAANDGMLHAFDAATGDEQYAFIPAKILSYLPRLSDANYSHKQLLDVTPVVQDVYFDGAWHTVLVAGMKGGQGLYALDITDPGNINLLWEFSDADDADLGFVYQQPSIAKLANDKWAVISSNGYNNSLADSSVSTSGHASILLIDIEDGSVIKKLDTQTGSIIAPNSLSQPSVVDVDGDLVVDFVYAGDLLGNVWRFDLIDAGDSPAFAVSAPVDWQVGLAGEPMFSAKDGDNNPQPITSRLQVIRHPAAEGHLVLFGTGRYLQQGDALANTNKVQSFYGLWDWQTDGAISVAARTSSNQVVSRSSLKSRTLSDEISQASFGLPAPAGSGLIELRDVRTSNIGVISWKTSEGVRDQLGWYMDLLDGGEARGELQISNSLVSGELLLFTTLTPSIDRCSAAGVETWLYGLRAATGERYLFPYYDLNRDQEVNLEDFLVTADGPQTATAIRLDALLAPSLVGNQVIYNGLNGTTSVLFEDGSLRKGRQSWRRLN
ncbi:pilus assembly protein [Pelagibaculum spongiae]|nr:PilC/PilY family type IV pilus protein [Pelagibaculum spongiae]